MPDTLIPWMFFGAYILLIILAARTGIRRVTGFTAYSVGSRQVSPYVVGLSLAANLTSAATFVINPGLIYLYGISGFIGYGIATPLGIFLGLAVLSKAFRRVGDRYTALTVPQWIGDRYQSRQLRLLFGFLSLLLITFLVLIVVGLTLVLEQVLLLPREVAMALVILLPLIYIILGGASAHTLTNAAQASIMIIVALMLLASGFHYLNDGLGAFLHRLASIDPLLALPVNPESLLFRNWFEVVIANFVIGLAIITQPHVISKALYLRTEQDVNRYLGSAFVVLSLFFSVLAVGLFARLVMPEVMLPPDQIVPNYLVKVFAPLSRSLVMIGLIAAGFSTMEGLLVALATIFSNDIFRMLAGKRWSREEAERFGVRYSKIFLLLLTPVVALIAYRQILHPNLSVAILAQNGVYGLFSATFAPILFGIFSRRISATGATLAAVTALLVHFGMYYGQISPYWNNPAVPATCAILSSTAVAALSLLLAPEKSVSS